MTRVVLFLCLTAAWFEGQEPRPQPKTAASLSAAAGANQASRLPKSSCPKPAIWDSIEIPQFRSAADLGWTWVNDRASSLDKMASDMQQKLSVLAKSAQSAAGKYSETTVRKDIERYASGIREMSSCGSFGAEVGLLEMPVIGLGHLTNRVNVIRELRQEAKNPKEVHGWNNFNAAEASAYEGSGAVDGIGFRITHAVGVAVRDDLSARAQNKLDQIEQLARVELPSAAARTAPTTAKMVRNSSQEFRNSGLTRPPSLKTVRSYGPSTQQNYTSMRAFLEGDRSLAEAPVGETIGEKLIRGEGSVVFAFEDASEELEVRADGDLDKLQIAQYLAESVDAAGALVQWADITRYTDYRDVRYTASQTCSFCDAALLHSLAEKAN